MFKNKGQRDYEKEIREAAQRMKKYPEHLKAAKHSSVWYKFLLEIGVDVGTVETKKGKVFWEKVRTTITPKIIEYTPRQLAEANVEMIFGIYRDVKGRFTSKKTDTPVKSYRDKETGRFISREAIDKR